MDSTARRRTAACILSLLESRRANTSVEFAILGSALVLCVLGIVEAGRALWTQNALHYAVEEAARCASINTASCGTPAQVQSFATTRSGANFATSVFSVSTAACGNQVSASYPMNLNIPFMSYSLTLTAQSCYPI